MDTGTWLKVFIIFLGIFLLVKAIISLAKRNMTEQFCLVWAVLSGLLIIIGILLQPSQLDHYVSNRILVLIFLMVIGIVWGLWFISTQVSILRRKNQELAMQISLLNNDIEKIMKEVEKLKNPLKEKSTRSDEQ